MDNVTHTLTALALARAGLGKCTQRGTLLLIIAANIPDIDMISWVEGRLKMLEIHRGYLHSVLFLPLMAALAVILTALMGRRRLAWRAAWLVAMAGVASHLILDWSMAYGIRLMLPFSSKWYALDLLSLTDWVILLLLAFAWLGPLLSRLVSDEIGAKRQAGRGAAITALIAIVVYGGFRAMMHERALSQLSSRVYDSVLEGNVERTAAFPQSFNPFSWNGIVETERAYGVYEVSAYGNFDPSDGTVLYKHPPTPAVDRAAATETFRYFEYFARFPYWQESEQGDGKRVTVTDLRFGVPGANFFEATAELDPAGRLESVRLGPARVQ